MTERLTVRLFYSASCGCCKCGPNQSIMIFEVFAERLTEKFGSDKLQFEAYNAVDYKRFPFLQKNTKTPAICVGEKLMSAGKLLRYQDLENEVGRQLKVT